MYTYVSACVRVCVSACEGLLHLPPTVSFSIPIPQADGDGNYFADIVRVFTSDSHEVCMELRWYYKPEVCWSVHCVVHMHHQPQEGAGGVCGGGFLWLAVPLVVSHPACVPASYVHVCVCMYVCMCVCVCDWLWTFAPHPYLVKQQDLPGGRQDYHGSEEV